MQQLNISASDPATTHAEGATRDEAATPDAFLRMLADRIREARARRGMSRKTLARQSSVSERYLAQMEAGKGNASILVLRQVGRALGVSVEELLRQDRDQSTQLLLLTQLLRRLPAAQLAALRARLAGELGVAGAARHGRIALIGLRGAGKSTLGARLARKLDVPFIELDRQVEQDAGISLEEIFLLYGRSGYRRHEQRALERVIDAHDRAVIATGGSIVAEAATYDLLRSSCYTVWLRARPEEHMARVVAQGDLRPMAGNREAMDDLRRILSGREHLYGQADAQIDTSAKRVEQALAELLKAIETREVA